MINIFFVFNLIVLLAFVVRTIRQIFFQVYLWQLKEYRLDRIIAFLNTSQGRKLLFSPLPIIKWSLLIFIYGFAYVTRSFIRVNYSNVYIVIAFYLFWLIWILEFIKSFNEFKKGRWRSPKLTLKSISLLAAATIIQFLPIIQTHWTYVFLFGPVLDRILGFTILVLVILVNIPFALYKYLIYLLAQKKIRKLNMPVIGITGSFGKTSTKEFLNQLLSQKYKVAKTPGSFNTDYSVSSFILKDLKNKPDYLIVEMAAYKPGEIKKICKLVNPKLAVITGIGNQHLELFGSMDNLVKAKSELIDSLSSEGKLFIALGNDYLMKMKNWAEAKNIKVITAALNNDLRNVKEYKSFLNFDYNFNGTAEKLKVNLTGSQHLSNLLLAIKVASHLGVTIAGLKKGILKIKAPDKTMQIIKNRDKLTLIDDTFNVNFESVIAALKYMKQYDGLKILILNPLIELGSQSKSVHLKIGIEAGDVCDYLLVTNGNYMKDIKEGIDKSRLKKTKLDFANTAGINHIKSNLLNDSVVICSGRESAKWISHF